MAAAMTRREDRWRHLVGAGVSIVFALPLVFMLSGSLREPGLAPSVTPELVPSNVSLDAYRRAFDLVELGRYGLNSAIVAALSVPLAVVAASWAGLAMTLLPTRPRRMVVVISLLAVMVPLSAVLVGRFTLFRSLGVLDTYWPLVAPSLMGMTPLYALLFHWAFGALPRELFDAARVEGLSPLGIWRRVAMPLSRPVITAVAALAFLTSWSSFLEPLVYLFDQRNFTLPLGLRALAELDRTDTPTFLAGAVVATLPVMLALALAQRAFRGSARR